jgi:hypothetical protein
MERSFTRQQIKMIDLAGWMWRKDFQPDLQYLMRKWHDEISGSIPLYSIFIVYDYLCETGYYNPMCL